jgi:D-amino-acid oxidase
VPESVAIIGAGVSGLTCGVAFAERGYRTLIFAKEVGRQTTSGAAAAVWFPYDAEPPKKIIPWALQTFDVLGDLARVPATGVSMIELRQFSRTREIQIPDWAILLGAQAVIPSSPSAIPSEVENGAAGEAATWTGRPEAERTGSE